MPDVEATAVPKGRPNPDRWNRVVTPREQDVSGTIHVFDVDVVYGGPNGLAVESTGHLAVVWGTLKKQP